MENNTSETVISKPKRPKPVPGRKRGPGKKPFEEKSSLQPGYALQYYNEKRNVPILCHNCGRETTKAKLHRHVKTLYCSRHTKDPGEIEELQKAFAQTKDTSNMCLYAPG